MNCVTWLSAKLFVRHEYQGAMSIGQPWPSERVYDLYDAEEIVNTLSGNAFNVVHLHSLVDDRHLEQQFALHGLACSADQASCV